MIIHSPRSLAFGALLLLLLGAVPVLAISENDLDDYPSRTWYFAGTRSETLGQADVADTRGPLSGLLHPAPLHEGQGFQVAYNRQEYWQELNLHNLGISWEKGPVRLAFARQQMGSDDLYIRYSEQPSHIHYDHHQRVFSLGLDMAQLLQSEGNWDWTLGASERHYETTIRQDVQNWDRLDFGSTVRFHKTRPNFRSFLGFSAVLRNADLGDLDTSTLHGGMVLGLMKETDAGGDLVGANMMVSLESKGVKRLGMEVLLGEHLKLRVGYGTEIYQRIILYGAGVKVPQPWIKPLDLFLDWGVLDTKGYRGGLAGHLMETIGVRGRLAL